MTCHHHEVIVRKEGKQIGTCKKCGQVRQYDPRGIDKPIVLKEGNMATLTDDTKIEIKYEPVPYKKMDKGEVHRFLEKHKRQILHDASTMGQKAARKHWGIKSSTWCSIMHRWVPWRAPYTDVLISKASENSEYIKSTSSKGVAPVLSPRIPEWNEAWSDIVKVAWLECAKSLIINSPLPMPIPESVNG